MEKILYLRKFSKTIEFVDYQTLSDSELMTFPLYWKNAFDKEFMNDKIDCILSEWNKYNYQFKTTTAYLNEHLKEIELVRNKNDISILYTIENIKGKDIYYIGKNPYTKVIPKTLVNKWDRIPENIKILYDEFHNGWYYFASESNGFSSVENIIILGDIEWGILDTIDIKTLPFNLDNCLGFFHNGDGSYVCYDLMSKDDKKGFIWFKNKIPKINIEFFPYLDEWTTMSLEE